MTTAKAAPAAKATPAISPPVFPVGHLVFEQRGSTIVCHHKDTTAWPILLQARKVYYGTDRLLSTLSLGRVDEVRPTHSRLILTSHTNLLVSNQRDSFAKTATGRIKDTVGISGSAESIQRAIGGMLDAMCEHILQMNGEIESFTYNEIEVPADLTPPYVVWPLVPASRPGMLVGPSGTGKSTIAMAAGLSVVTGLSIIDRIVPKVTGNVLYVGQEETKEQWAARLTMMCRGHDIPPPAEGYIYLKLKGSNLIEAAENLAELAARAQAKLIIIDSAQATWGVEGDGVRGHASEWFNAAADLGVPVLIVDHPNLQGTSKPGSNAGGMAAGSSVKRDRAGHQWYLKSVEIPTDPGQPKRYHVTLVDTKRNYVPKQDDITYETLVYGYQSLRFVESGPMNAETVLESPTRNDQRIVGVMLKEPKDGGWSGPEVANKLGLRDPKHLYESLDNPLWRPASWVKAPNGRFRFESVEGTGGSKTNPKRYALKVESDQVVWDPDV